MANDPVSLEWTRRRRPSNPAVDCWLLLFFACIVITVLGTWAFPWQQRYPTPGVCTSPACVIAAGEILQNFSPHYPEIDPCTDFHSLVCGGWKLRNELPSTQTTVWSGSLLQDKVDRTLIRVLEAPSSSPQDTSTLGPQEQTLLKLRHAYSACMDEEALREEGARPLLDLLSELKKILGTSQQAYSRAQLSDAFSFLSGIGVSPFVALTVERDEQAQAGMVVRLSAAEPPGLPDVDSYANETVTKEYSRAIYQVFERLSLPKWTNPLLNTSQHDFEEHVESRVAHLLDIETKLARATTTAGGDSTHLTTELDAMLPRFSVEQIITSVVGSFRPAKFVVSSMLYVETVSRVLSDYDNAAIETFLIWKVIQKYASTVYDDAVDPYIEFERAQAGIDPSATKARSNVCVRLIRSDLAWSASSVFYDHLFNSDAVEFGHEILTDLKASFDAILDSSSWMSSPVRASARAKLDSIATEIGYPTLPVDTRNATAVNEYYRKVSIRSDSHFSNALALSRAKVFENWSRVNHASSIEDGGNRGVYWSRAAVAASPYYSSEQNALFLPAAVMSPPVMYDQDVPAFLTYGAFGSIAGHELSHALDSHGRHFDERGSRSEWWDAETSQRFEENAQCFVDQFDNFPAEIRDANGSALYVDGSLTLNENLADTGGVRVAYEAWRSRDARRPDKMLPGLESFTKEQLFFVSLGAWWCAKLTPEESAWRLRNDPHAPFGLRTRGTLENSRAFREAFGCAVKEPTCQLW